MMKDNIFSMTIPFPDQAQWQMLKVALDGDHKASELSKKLDWPISKVRQMVMGDSSNITIRDFAEWHWACGVKPPEIKIIPL